MLFFCYEIFIIVFPITFIRLSNERICLIQDSVAGGLLSRFGRLTYPEIFRMSSFIDGFNLFVNSIANFSCTFVIFLCQDLIKEIFKFFQGIFE